MAGSIQVQGLGMNESMNTLEGRHDYRMEATRGSVPDFRHWDASALWLEDTFSAAWAYQVDGSIYCGALCCRNTWGMVKPFARDTEASGIPTLILFADAFDGRITSWDVRKTKMEFSRVRKIIK